ncbi:MAG: hypothetical protein KJN89_00125 [Gammaproteobacteria bacterium]|nr:hypothetical protein [Gammaproteobacteria bacterium]MBT8133002.1 hypothetical protein [Gammaproteobacteria bacterium]NNJ48746.1 hypothetical protein [Gammaproteobacteria bacterium]
MIKVNTKMLSIAAAAVISMASMVVNAAGEMKPFILASTGTGAVADKVADVKKSLTDNGFEVAGEYSPYDNAHIIIVTDSTLKKVAGSHERGGYAAGQRVAITKLGDQLQITYTNPAYMAAAYHVKGDVSSVTNALNKALGSVKEFGPEDGMTAEDIKGYHYTFGMEYFDEPYDLATYNSYEEAVAAVEKGLAEGAGGTSKVYRIDIPGKKQTLFGVAMSSETTGNKYMDDTFIMSEIDFKDVRSTAHLPYDILVTGDSVEGLHARFRIAINFPDLSMMGANSFMNIMPSPDAIRDSLTKAAGGTIEEEF